MRAYYGSRISENQTVTPEGYLICLNVPIARTGVQQYMRSELGIMDDRPNELCNVIRTDDEVFAPATIASFEGKPVCDDHPPVSVTTENVTAYDSGHAQNVRRGQGDESNMLIADLFITSPRLIDDIKNGRREVSCGYDCEYTQDEKGQIFQRSIRGNHVAVVSAGRAGSRVAIKDSSEPISLPSLEARNEIPTKTNERGKKIMANRNNSLVARLFSRAVKDMEPDEVADAIEELNNAKTGDEQTEAPASKPTPTPAATDNGEVMKQILTALTALTEQVKQIAATPRDAEPAHQPPAAAKPAPDPLDALAREIVEKQAETPADQEASVTVPPEEIPKDELPEETEQTDEDVPVAAAAELTKNPIPGADRAIALAAINAIKPIIATLPESQRRAASDRAAGEIRKLIGKDAKPATNGYAGIMSVMRQAAKKQSRDSRPNADDGAIGRSIMTSRNPHYKAKA